MKKISEHLGQIIIALAGIILCVIAVVSFRTQIGGFFAGIVGRETSVGTSIVNSMEGINLSNLSGVPTIEELENQYEFDYYNSLALAVTDVNNDTIGKNACVDKEDAVAGIYVDEGNTYVVLLKDTTETGSIMTQADMTINLGGNTLYRSTNSFGIAAISGTLAIDGRLSGSTIDVVGNATTIAAVAVSPTGKCAINGGTYKCTTSGVEQCMGLYAASGSNLTVNNAKIHVSETAYKSVGVSVFSGASVVLSDCYITAFANYSATTSESGSSQYVESSTGIHNSGGKLTLNNCYARGVHSGVGNYNDGVLNICGGIYEGYGHGGVYFASSGSISYIKDATFRECGMPSGYSSSHTTNSAGLYIGEGSDMTVYMDNCDIDGSKYPIVLRGSGNEQNNILYISNSKINKDYSYGIRIDNDTHKLYIGAGNNFTVDDTKRPEVVIETDAVYR